MKILIIHGSPHKGQTYETTMEFLQELGNRIEIDVKHVFLFQERLELCRGCGTCILYGENRCSIKDGFREIHSQIQGADAVILTTPVYSLHVTAMVKNFIDRSAYIMHRPRYFGKWFMSLSTQAISGDKEVAKYLATVFHSWGFNIIPGLRITTVPDKNVIQAKINVAVGRFLSIETQTQFPIPGLKDFMMFRVRRTVMNSQSFLNTFPRDVEYFRERGWMKSPYYYRVHLNPLKKVIGRFFEALGRKMLKSDDRLEEQPTNGNELVEQVATVK